MGPYVMAKGEAPFPAAALPCARCITSSRPACDFVFAERWAGVCHDTRDAAVQTNRS